MFINIAERALTQLPQPMADMLILRNCLSVVLKNWAEIEESTSDTFCRSSVRLFSADCCEGRIPYPVSNNRNNTKEDYRADNGSDNEGCMY